MSTRTRALWSFDAIGTAWTIETADPLPAEGRREVDAVISAFDRSWSRFRDDSTVSALARSGGSVDAPADAAAMLELYAELDEATSGAVHPLVGDALARLGYDARLVFDDRAGGGVPGPVGRRRTADGDGGGARPEIAPWRDALTWDGGRLSLAAPATIDVGALGKGRLVDLVLDVVLPHARGEAVVDASGDLAVRGGAQRIGLEHPYHPDRVIGTIEVTDEALCASATNRRAWGDGLHHVLDGRTGEPVRAYAATWAIAPTAMLADAAATALFFDGGPEFAWRRGVEWVRMRTDGRVEWSPGSRAEVFS
jgi:FAD:protein FMN transferase